MSGAQNVYANVTLSNLADGAQPVPLKLSTTLPSDIIKNSDSYFISIARWNLDGGASLPIFIWPTPGQGNDMFVTLAYGGASVTQILLYPGYDGWGPSTAGFPTNSIYSYGTFVKAVNTALTTAFTALSMSTLLPGGATAPSMFWNGNTDKFDLLFDGSYLESHALPNRMQLNMSNNLYRLFQNYEATLFTNGGPVPIPADPTQPQFLIRVYDQSGMNSPPVANIPAGKYLMTQEFASPGRLSYYNGVATIRIKSNTLNARFEYIVGIDASLQATSAGSAIPTSNVMSTYVIAGGLSVADPAGYRQEIVYLPTAVYKLTDLLSGRLNTIDFVVTWLDQQGNEYPFMLMADGVANIVVAWFHKDLYLAGGLQSRKQ